MKRYYNSTTKEWYTEGNSITKNISNGVFSGIPSVEQLESWGFEEWVEPTPTPEELLARAKANKIAELEAYDQSEVNSFSVNGKDMWLDHDLRQQLRISLDALSQAGRETVTKWFDGVEYTYPIDVWYYMLGLVEVYASDALNVTEGHKAAINALESVGDVEAYQFEQGYPEKLAF
jgi:hypothetical protein